jgi:LysM repeat protein
VTVTVTATTGPSSTPTGPPSNLASGSLTNCTSYHTVVSGDSCTAIEAAAGISATDLLRWNPEVNVDTCYNIEAGLAYCVGGGGA